MTTLPFEKVEGLGNHFVLIDEVRSGPRDWTDLARSLCAHGTGIGGDGLLVVGEPKSSGALRRMRMFNPDGSEDMCGNGLRCVAHVAVAQYAPRDGSTWIIDTIAGPREVQVTDAQSETASVRASLGHPVLSPADMPARVGEGLMIDQEFVVGDERVTVSLISMGTPHCVIFGPPPDEATFSRLSPVLEKDSRFPEGISVMWATVVGPHEVRLRIWERAVGETQACGTGAAASAVAGILTGRLESPVRALMPGGGLAIEWPSQHSEVHQVGPSRRVYGGEFLVYD